MDFCNDKPNKASNTILDNILNNLFENISKNTPRKKRNQNINQCNSNNILDTQAKLKRFQNIGVNEFLL